MITGTLKTRIDAMWNNIASGGLTNPLEVVEQLTYLMFIRELEDMDERRIPAAGSLFPAEIYIGGKAADGDILRWSVLRSLSPEEMFQTMKEGVFPFIKSLNLGERSAYSQYMEDAVFKLPTPGVLAKTMECLDAIYGMNADIRDMDIRGDVYEYLLSKLAISGRNGQFRTPRHIIRMMVELMEPDSRDTICDPACGTAGFLIAAADYIREHRSGVSDETCLGAAITEGVLKGYDTDRTMLRIGTMNLMTHGINAPVVEYMNSLSEQNHDSEKYSLILANPPFRGRLDYDYAGTELLEICRTDRTELLFLIQILRMLKTGGRCAVIVPNGVLFGVSKAHRAVRKLLVEEHHLEAVISMPPGVFRPYTGISTAVLIFTKTGTGGTGDVRFYNMESDGFSLDNRRVPVKANDIPDIIESFRSADRTEQNLHRYKVFHVPKDEIQRNGYDLSLTRYKEIEPVSGEYPSSADMMSSLRRLESDILRDMDELESLINTKTLGSRGTINGKAK